MIYKSCRPCYNSPREMQSWANGCPRTNTTHSAHTFAAEYQSYDIKRANTVSVVLFLFSVECSRMFVRFAGGETPPLQIQMKQYLKIAFPDKGSKSMCEHHFKMSF